MDVMETDKKRNSLEVPRNVERLVEPRCKSDREAGEIRNFGWTGESQSGRQVSQGAESGLVC
jgi:hypothetical protein